MAGSTPDGTTVGVGRSTVGRDGAAGSIEPNHRQRVDGSTTDSTAVCAVDGTVDGETEISINSKEDRTVDSIASSTTDSTAVRVANGLFGGLADGAVENTEDRTMFRRSQVTV